MKRIWALVIVSLWSAMMCNAAPQVGAQDDPPTDTPEGSGADLKEATDLMTFLKMGVK